MFKILKSILNKKILFIKNKIKNFTYLKLSFKLFHKNMKLEIKTIDKKLITVPPEFIRQSYLLQDITNCTIVNEPVELEVTYHSTQLIIKFLERNNQIIERDGDPSKISMDYKIRNFFRELKKKEIAEFINASSYLFMPVLLECSVTYFANLIYSHDSVRDIIGDDSNITKETENEKQEKNYFNWLSNDYTEEPDD